MVELFRAERYNLLVSFHKSIRVALCHYLFRPVILGSPEKVSAGDCDFGADNVGDGFWDLAVSGYLQLGLETSLDYCCRSTYWSFR